MMGVTRQRYLELAQMFNRPLAREYVAANLLVAGQLLTSRNVSQALRQITTINPNVELYVLDAQGRILNASASTGRRLVQDHIDIRPIEQFLAGGAGFPLLDVDPTGLWSRNVFSAARLFISGTPARYLYVVLNRREDGPITERLQADYKLGDDAGVILITMFPRPSCHCCKDHPQGCARVSGMSQNQRPRARALRGETRRARAQLDFCTLGVPVGRPHVALRRCGNYGFGLRSAPVACPLMATGGAPRECERDGRAVPGQARPYEGLSLL